MFLVVTTIVLIILLFLLIKKKNKSQLQLPEPPANFIFGHSLQISSTTKILGFCTAALETFGNTMKFRIGPTVAPLREAVLTQDYKLIEFILSGHQILAKGESYNFLKPWLGQGLLVSEGAYWRRHRKILTPAFHFEILKEFIDVFENVGSKLLKKLGEYDGEASVDLDPLVTLCTLDIICETAMGTKINAQSGQNAEYVKSVKDMCRIVIGRNISPVKFFDNTFWLTKDYYKQKSTLKILHEFTKSVISSKKRKEINKQSGKKMAFLDILLTSRQDGTVMDDSEISEEVDTFMFEGHDTTSSGICFTLYCLANNPGVQDKVLQEQKELFGDEKNPTVTLTEIQNMKYLERVIKETLRLYPSVPVLGRYTREDTWFEGHLIPKDTNIVIFVYGIHRNPEYFLDPEKFDPDRFENFDGSLPYAYIPFSAGPRNCIGQKFAMLEMKSIVSKIIRHFEVTPASPKHELTLSVEAVLKSASGIKVGLRKRI